MTSIKTAIRSVVQKGNETVAEFNRKRLPALDRPHPYLTAIYEPITRELAIDDLAVAGTIPAELDGRYLRIGPNPVAPDPRSYHWFIGDGMVHGVRIQAGRAQWYRNRWIRSEKVAKALQVSAAPGPRHGTFDTVNTNVIGHAGATCALVEAGSTPVRLKETLEGQTYDDFGCTLKGAFTAHPHRDPATGELHAICYNATETDEIRHVVVSPEGRVVRELAIPVRHGPSIHDCAITDRFVIILDLPVTFSMAALIGGRGFPYRWNESHEARIGLLPRATAAPTTSCGSGSTPATFSTPQCLRPFRWPRRHGRGCLRPHVRPKTRRGLNENPRGLECWTIDPSRGSPSHGAVERRILDRSPQEFPQIDERRTGKPHRFLYSLGPPETANEYLAGATHVLKHDLETGARQLHDFGTGRFPGEFVFVPHRADAQEDDGWVISFVVDMQRSVTELAILDARAVETDCHRYHSAPRAGWVSWATGLPTGPTVRQIAR